MNRRDMLKLSVATAAAAMGSMASAQDPSPPPPNVLWLMTDEQRPDSLGCYGAPWAVSPNLDKLANEGVVFTSAYTPSPVCTPARLALLSGMYCSRTTVWTNIGMHKNDPPLLTDVFRKAGYASASFGKQHYAGPTKAFDVESGPVLSKQVDCYAYAPEYDESQYDVVKHPQPAPWILGGRFPAPIEETAEYQCVEGAKTWLGKLPAEQPFLLRLSFSAPHTPVVPPAPFDTMIPEDAITLPPEADPLPPECAKWTSGIAKFAGSAGYTPEQVRKIRRYYYCYCAFVDAQFGRLLDWMRERGLLDNTIVAFVSDHGTSLCDHGLVQKGTFYEQVAGVPFFFWYPPAVAAGRKLDTPVETRSLLPTLISLAGLEVPETCASINLAAQLGNGSEPAPRPVFSEIGSAIDPRHPDGRLVMARDGEWKLTWCADSPNEPGELINLTADPYEQRNLFGKPEGQAAQEHLLGLITAHLVGTPKPCANVKVLDELLTDATGAVLCPLCKRAKSSRVDPTPDWSEGLSPAYQCGHCGTRFGVKATPV